MQKSKKKSKKITILLIILLISMFIAFPIEEKNPNEIFNTLPPQESSVYYENTTGHSFGVYVSGDYAYVADRSSGLAVIDISDPTDPGTPVYEDTTGYAYSVYVSGDYAYVADGMPGLAVIDISNPTNPGTPIYEDTNRFAFDVYISGDYAYVADDNTGLAVIQIRKRFDLENPIISNSPSDFIVELGYTGQSISWTATDFNPNTYTIQLQGSVIVAGPTTWTSGVAINYNIPDGLAVGVYFFTISFTDDYSNYITDTVTVTINSVETPEGGIPFGNYFLIFIGLSVIFLIFAKKRQINREFK